MDKIPTYLAPEDLDRISKNELFDASNEVGEAFSIGLSVLSAGTLSDFEDLYDLNSNSFNFARFNEALHFWRSNNSYSEVLRGTVSCLCQPDVGKRLTTSELLSLLEKHHQSIEQKVNFLVDNAPAKLHQEIMNSRQLLMSSHQQPPVQVYHPPIIQVQEHS